MEMNLQPQATMCFVSGQPFSEGDRVVSHLVRADSLEILRYDVAEVQAPEFKAEGKVVCHWVHIFKPRTQQENSDRAMKLTAESLFLALADPANELDSDNTRLVQFLALMLERKKLLRPRGKKPSGDRVIYEHAKTKQLYEVPAGEMDPAFFVAVQQQLSVLTGGTGPGEGAAAAVAEPMAG
jgi:hypothetical protein